MDRKKFPLASSSWDDKEINALQRVIDSRLFTMGKYVEEFESRFATYLGTKYCVMVNSGSSANLLMIAALIQLTNRINLKGVMRLLFLQFHGVRHIRRFYNSD